jgi:ABC-type transporter Mla MlaB component
MSFRPPRGLSRVGAAAQQTIAFALAGPLSRDDLPSLCDRLSVLLERTGARLADCDVSRADPDAVTVDALARLQLAARRRGSRLRLRHASSELLALIAFMGLEAVLG